jgi:hypothetical protein
MRNRVAMPGCVRNNDAYKPWGRLEFENRGRVPVSSSTSFLHHMNTKDPSYSFDPQSRAKRERTLMQRVAYHSPKSGRQLSDVHSMATS